MRRYNPNDRKLCNRDLNKIKSPRDTLGEVRHE
jgi:hypothetical protein